MDKKDSRFFCNFYLREASVVHRYTFLISLYGKCILFKASSRDIIPLSLIGFLTHSYESLAHSQCVSLGERGFVLFYAKPLTPVMCYRLASTRRQPASSLPRSGPRAPNLGPRYCPELTDHVTDHALITWLSCTDQVGQLSVQSLGTLPYRILAPTLPLGLVFSPFRQWIRKERVGGG